MSKEINYSIRRAREEDAQGLVLLVARGMPGYPFESVYDVEAIRQEVRSSPDQRIVAVGDGSIVGTAVLEGQNHGMVEIKRVVVSPGFRQNGLATALTQYLTESAIQRGATPWIDARACQLGMQKASLNSGYTAISLEIGKHCVYFHLDPSGTDPVGPGRETMVHLSSLRPDFHRLSSALSRWPLDLLAQLVLEMQHAFSPQPKNSQTVKEHLGSARMVKNRIDSNLKSMGVVVQPTANEDVVLVTLDGSKMVVVRPDASGFLVTAPDQNLEKVVKLGHHLGLQTITSYVDADKILSHEQLQRASMRPTMLRLWQGDGSNPTWQVGWRSTANHFNECLHYVNIHPEIKQQINDLITRI